MTRIAVPEGDGHESKGRGGSHPKTRIAVPEGGISLFDHQPELFAAFNRFYGTLWSEGQLDQAAKEVGRLRNARVNDCNI